MVQMFREVFHLDVASMGPFHSTAIQNVTNDYAGFADVGMVKTADLAIRTGR